MPLPPLLTRARAPPPWRSADDLDLCTEEGLSEGWKQIDDPEAGTYFFNFLTGESVWERPLR